MPFSPNSDSILLTGVVVNDVFGQFIYRLKTHLTTAPCNWTVVGSYNGTTQNYGGTDLFTAYTAFTAATNAGVILRDAGNLCEWGFFRGSTAANITVIFNPCNGDNTKYLAGTWNGSNLPTATWAITLVSNGTSSAGAGDYRIHVTAETAFPYGWTAQLNTSLTASQSRISYANWPLTEQPAGANCPYLPYTYSSTVNGGFYASSSALGAESTTPGVAGHPVFQAHGTPAAPVACCAPVVAIPGGGAVMWPRGMSQDASNDTTRPIEFMKSSGLYFGATDYVHYIGQNRNNLDTIGSGADQRIVLGDICVPWESTVSPVP